MKNYTNMSNREKFNSTNAVEDFVQNITTFKSFINDIHIEFHACHHHRIVLANRLDDYEMVTLLSFYFFLLPLLCSFP